MTYEIPNLPLEQPVESLTVLKKVASARSALAEMKGSATSIPNESILIDTLSLQEAKDSSEIENIITTHDELYQSDLSTNSFKSVASKEVHSYAQALRSSFLEVKDMGFISNNQIIRIQSMIEANDAGFRKVPGTALKNEQTGEIICTPPQHPLDIKRYMDNLEQFINDSQLCTLDPLVKMAIIHHQFESIHPFYDGNGRTGRIINILYLVKEGLLDLPILYLSRYINHNKGQYYQLLQHVREQMSWENWILFILNGVEETSLQTINIIAGIKSLMLKHKQSMRINAKKIYSQDLLNNIFRHPYTKIDFVMKELEVSRPTATKYLELLCQLDILDKVSIGRENYYINRDLYHLLREVSTSNP